MLCGVLLQKVFHPMLFSYRYGVVDGTKAETIKCLFKFSSTMSLSEQLAPFPLPNVSSFYQ